jgi:hypothetical protein
LYSPTIRMEGGSASALPLPAFTQDIVIRARLREK